MESRLVSFAILALCSIVPPASAAGQDEPADRPGRLLVAPAAPDPVVGPRAVPADPEREVLEAFHRSLDGAGAEAARRARLARARRVADFDLAWGLE